MNILCTFRTLMYGHVTSLSFIVSGRSSGLHLASSHSCCMHVRAGCPAFARPYVGVHRSTSLKSSSLLLQQCPTCLVRLTCIVFVMGETQFLLSSGHVDTAIWMHYLDANKTAGEKARRQLHKNAASNIEQVLEETPHKTPFLFDDL